MRVQFPKADFHLARAYLGHEKSLLKDMCNKHRVRHLENKDPKFVDGDNTLFFLAGPRAAAESACTELRLSIEQALQSSLTRQVNFPKVFSFRVTTYASVDYVCFRLFTP